MHPDFRTPVRQRATRRNGQATVEFALTIPFLVMLLIGTFGVVIILFSYVTAQSAAREGVRFLISNPHASDAQIQARICATNGVGLGGTQAGCLAKITSGELAIFAEPAEPANPDDSPRQPDVQVDVVVKNRVPVPTIRVPMPGGAAFTVLAPISVTATSAMRIE